MTARPRPPHTPPPARRTLRQALRLALEAGADFDELCTEFELTPRQLDEELQHLRRTLRRQGQRLQVEPATCLGCGARLPPRGHRLRPPQRCPRCRAERIAGPRLGIAGGCSRSRRQAESPPRKTASRNGNTSD